VHYPNGAFFALMESRYYRALCETRKAIEIADNAKSLVSELPSVEIMFSYQAAWCYFFCLDWQPCAEDFDKLLHSTLNGSYQRQPTQPCTLRPLSACARRTPPALLLTPVCSVRSSVS
jgi:hypothetical protein